MSCKPVPSDSPSLWRAGEAAFDCTLDDGGRGAALVRVAGELDRATAPFVARTLREATRRARVVVVDLRGLTRVDTSGVGAIVDASHSARRDGRRMVVVRGRFQVERLLALSGASNAVEIIDLAPGEPTINALLQIARIDRINASQQPRAPRRLATLLSTSQVVRSVDALIARSTQHDWIDG